LSKDSFLSKFFFVQVLLSNPIRSLFIFILATVDFTLRFSGKNKPLHHHERLVMLTVWSDFSYLMWSLENTSSTSHSPNFDNENGDWS